MKRVAFETLGCKLNFSETSSMRRDFEHEGYELAEFTDPADIYVINTCSVTMDANSACRKTVRQALRRNPEAFVAVVGCYAQLEPEDKLKFKHSKRYKDRLLSAQKNTGEKDALIAMEGTLNAMPVVAVAFEFNFMGGSMGAIVGERFIQAVNVCLEKRIPLICFSASGGARMQEALISLMQMAKTSAGLEKLKQEGIPYISAMTDPVFGGVSASLAMLGDLNIAEPNALIGFAGPRVIEQTVREKLPEGFQRSEFLLDKGALDMIIPRHELRDRIFNILSILTNKAA